MQSFPRLAGHCRGKLKGWYCALIALYLVAIFVNYVMSIDKSSANFDQLKTMPEQVKKHHSPGKTFIAPGYIFFTEMLLQKNHGFLYSASDAVGQLKYINKNHELYCKDTTVFIFSDDHLPAGLDNNKENIQGFRSAVDKFGGVCNRTHYKVFLYNGWIVMERGN